MNRIVGLDILRAVAVVLVLFRHIPNADNGGWVGVDLFFVLSGWLVSGLLFKEHNATGTISPGRFLLRRGFKIYPAFWAFLALSAPIVWRLHGHRFEGERWIRELLFFQNYAEGVWPHTWSLAVEEHFYILLTGLLAVLFKFGSVRLLPTIFSVVAIACLAMRLHAASTHGPNHYLVLFPTHLRIDSLLFGALLSYWHHCAPSDHWFRRIRPGAGLAITGAALFVPPFIFGEQEFPWLIAVYPALCYLGGGLLVLTVGQWRTSSKVPVLVAAFGAASYSTYLWHLFALDVSLFAQKHTHFPVLIPLYFVSSAAIGMAMARLVEAPSLRLRDKLFPSANGGRTTVVAGLAVHGM